MGEPQLHRAPRRVRGHRPRHAPLGGVRALTGDRVAHGAHFRQRFLQEAAGTQLDSGGVPLPAGARPGHHWGDAALGPSLLLDCRCRDPRRQLHAALRQPAAGDPQRRLPDGPGHPDPVLRHPHLAVAGTANTSHRAAPDPAASSRRTRLLGQLRGGGGGDGGGARRADGEGRGPLPSHPERSRLRSADGPGRVLSLPGLQGRLG